ncbi:MAG TPA: dihydropteroate synthase, partial [Marmoricola sp.]|nr:dihydropteroate synthase [Marmoricola sp.]
KTMQDRADYTDVVADVRRELSERVEACLAAGIAAERLILDPGLGFAKTAEHNWELLRGLDELGQLGFPLLVGASRKSFLGSLLAAPDGTPRPIDDREAATVALTTILAQRDVWGIRVHDVRASRDALRVVGRLRH